MPATASGLILLIFGLLTVLGAIFNWRFVVGRGKLLPRLLEPSTARILMCLLGLLLIALGLGFLAGILPA